MWKFYIGMALGSIVIVIFLVLSIVYFARINKHNNKIRNIGRAAEIKINDDIKVWAKHTGNLFIPNTIFSYGQNKIFEVDSVLITSKALIVIEIKSIKGDIDGDASSLEWNKRLGTEVFKIGNPIIQNEKHIDHIVRMTAVKVPTISLIIFSNRANSLRVENIPSHALVIRHGELFDTLDEINNSLPEALNDYEKKSIMSILKKNQAKKAKDKLLHKRITRKGRR